MSLDSRSQSFDPRRRFPAIGDDGAALFEEPGTALPFEAAGSPDDPARHDADEALEQLGSEGCWVCPLCGAIVASDGSVLG